MSCENYQEMLALQVSGDLPAGQARHLEKHLHDCRDCRKLEEQLRAGRQALVGLAAAEAPPASIRAEVLERIAADPRPGTGGYPGWRLAGAAAAAVLLLALILVQLLPGRDPAPLTADSAATVDPPVAAADPVPGDPPGTGALPRSEETPVMDPAPPATETAAVAEVIPHQIDTRQPSMHPAIHEQESPPPPAEAVVVKMLTDDPDVVIYMLVDEEGDPRDA